MPEMVAPCPVSDDRCIREAVCIHTKKIFDSCKDEDIALSDVVRKVKLASIEDEMVHTSDIMRWQELLSLKNKMQKFSINRV